MIIKHISDYGSEGCGFDLCRVRQLITPKVQSFRGFFIFCQSTTRHNAYYRYNNR